jgi:hypothetical protein
LVDPSGNCYVSPDGEQICPPSSQESGIVSTIGSVFPLKCIDPNLCLPPPGLNEYGLAAWTGLITIASMEGAWWGDELDSVEAMMILLDDEVGNELYWNDFPQPVVDVMVNQYNNYCGGGPWTIRCLNKFWGYSEIIRESEANPEGSERFDYPNYLPQLRGLATGILNHSEKAENLALFHYGNAFGDIAALLQTDYSSGIYKYSSYLNSSGPNSVFAIQNGSQHCLTGSLQWWDGTDNPICNQ